MPVTISLVPAAAEEAAYSLLHLLQGVSPINKLQLSSSEALPRVEVDVIFTPAYIRPMAAGAIMSAANTMVDVPLPPMEFDVVALAGLQDDEQGRVQVRVRQGDTVLAEQENTLTWMPANRWLGAQEPQQQMLAALVQTEDPGVEALLSIASAYLQTQGGASTWRGATAGSNSVHNQLQALWMTLQAQGLMESTAPNNLLRTPTQSLAGSCASPLERALMLAAMVAKAGLNPVLLISDKYEVCCGAWMGDEMANAPYSKLNTELQAAAQEGRLLLLPTGGKGTSFAAAAKEGAAIMAQAGAQALFLDLARLWQEGMKTLCLQQGAARELSLKLPTAAAEPLMTEKHAPTEEELSLVSTKDATRFDTWQRKLLDMSLRNNMLNAPLGTRQLELVLPDLPALEDALSNGKSFAITPATDGLKQAGSASQAAACFSKGELLAFSTGRASVTGRLQQLYRDSRRALEETGSNPLYIAVGFIRWLRKGDNKHSYLAPLVLLPVEMSRRSAQSSYTLKAAEEDPRINLTLLELLKKEFSLRIPELEGTLPEDEHGLDIARIMEIAEKAIATLPGWGLEQRCSLGIFSFAKFLQWRDLTERRDMLLKNKVVSYIADRKRGNFEQGEAGFPTVHEMDVSIPAADFHTPLSSYCSHLSSFLAAARCIFFFLFVPPFTFSSLTISYMISQFLP